jgi:hypothetical protein
VFFGKANTPQRSLISCSPQKAFDNLELSGSAGSALTNNNKKAPGPFYGTEGFFLDELLHAMMADALIVT